jgi:tetratricopeptide (TPR) repeat protein
MHNEQIHPERITRPVQLLAAWLIALIAVDTAFLAAARWITTPPVPLLLTIAAVANVPLFVVGIFVLLTRFRAQMQEDVFYSQYVRDQRQIGLLSQTLGDVFATQGLDAVRVAEGYSLREGPEVVRNQVRELASSLQALVERVGERPTSDARQGIPTETLQEIGTALMADGRWSEAAPYLDEYSRRMPDDWAGHYARAVAHQNSRMGAVSNLAALRAYNDTVSLAPGTLDANLRGRLFTYRGAALKRLGRLAEAEADLELAKQLVSTQREREDLLYNLAGLYAMTGRKSQAIEAVRSLQETSYIASIRAHLNDYFRSIRNDAEFMSILSNH